MNKVLLSHQTDVWYTPKKLLDILESEFGSFDDDPALKTKNINWENDGLFKKWGKRVFCNPPYSNLEKWCAKAYEEFQKGSFIILLIPSRTDTIAWHQFCMKAQEIRFIKGRIIFEGAKASAPFPSAIIIFNPEKMTNKLEVKTMDYKNSYFEEMEYSFF